MTRKFTAFEIMSFWGFLCGMVSLLFLGGNNIPVECIFSTFGLILSIIGLIKTRKPGNINGFAMIGLIVSSICILNLAYMGASFVLYVFIN